MKSIIIDKIIAMCGSLAFFINILSISLFKRFFFFEF